MMFKDFHMQVTARLSPDGQFVDVFFPFDPTVVTAIKRMPGARFLRPKDGQPHWRLPKTIETGKHLTDAFGEGLALEKDFHNWATKRMAKKKRLTALVNATSSELPVLREEAPELWEAIHLGPAGLYMTPEERKKALENPEGSFQTADVMFMSECPNPVNSNHPGLGKTLEAIASTFESNLDTGARLVVAPLTSLSAVWVEHLVDWQYDDILLCSGHKALREDVIHTMLEYVKNEQPFWLVTNPATVRYEAVYEEDPVTGRRQGIKEMWLKHPELHDIEWDVVVLDEFHQMGLGNPNTLTAKALFDLKARKRIAMSGTPMGGKPIKLFGALHFLEPEIFTSKWQFAEEWLVMSHGYQGRTEWGDVRPEKQKEFDEFIAEYMIRRTKAECIPWLPPKQEVHLWAEMSPAQSRQYKQFALAAEVKIEDMQLSAASILAEYTRLKQFSNAKQKVEEIKDPPFIKPYPTEDSGKLALVEELLRERGILGGEDEVGGDEQVLIFSQFTVMVDMMVDWLKNKHGVHAEKITGAIPEVKRRQLVKEFQAEGGCRVMIMNTKAGGVSITLDKASTVIFMDETWDPDDQTQASDRVHRASRIHQVTIYYIRSRGTIEEYIQKRVGKKEDINRRILDLRREGFRALMEAE